MPRAQDARLAAPVVFGWLAACGDPGAPQAVVDGSAPPSLYGEVAGILERRCGIDRCHAGPLIGAGLYLGPGTDYRAALVNVEACEYDRMDLVEPGDPDRSWVMVKLTAPFRPLADPYGTYIYFEPDEGWDPAARRCQDATEDGEPLFGQRMPATAPNSLPENELALFRQWIAGGAPR